MSLQSRIQVTGDGNENDSPDVKAVSERSSAVSDPFAELKTRVHREIIPRLGPRMFSAEASDADLEAKVTEVVTELLAVEKTPLTRQERQDIIRQITDDILGYGPLEPFLRDDSITEVMVNDHNTIYIERHGKITRTNAQFVDEAHLLRIIDKIISRIGRRIDESSPYVDARLPDGSRVNAIIPPLALDGPTVTIRRFGSNPLKLEDLLNYKSLTPEMVMLLEGAMKAHLNIIISGGTGSGKTTLLNTLSSFISNEDRIVTIEDAAELQLQQDHVVRLETRPANIEGKGQIKATDLVRNCLRMRPDRIIIGECRGGETLDMLQAMNTGHDGSLTTCHANTPRDAIARLETMIMMAGFEMPMRAMRQQIANAVNLIVQSNRMQGGPRKVTHITEVVGMEQDTIVMQDIFKYNQDGVDERGRAVGHFLATGIRPTFMSRLESSGVRLPSSAFRERIMLKD
jgi:pilus assembly protein CpaF